MDEGFPGGSEPEAPPPYLGAGAPGSGQMSERMQTMLARAAEEQMAEQRQLQVLVNDVRASLTQLQQDVRQNASAGSLELVRGEVGGLGAEMRTATGQLGERLEAVVRALTASVQAVQSVGSQLETLHQQVAQQQGTLAGLPGLIQRAVADATHPPDTAVPAEVAALRAELTALRAEVAQLRASTADVVRSEVAGLGTHLDEAVLALVEAMLRRRGGASAAAAGSPVAAPVAAPGAPEPEQFFEPVTMESSAEVEAVPETDLPAEVPAVAPPAGVTSAAAPRLAPAPPAAPIQLEPDPAVEAEMAAPADEAQADVSGDDLGHEPSVTSAQPVAHDEGADTDEWSDEPFQPAWETAAPAAPADAVDDAVDEAVEPATEVEPERAEEPAGSPAGSATPAEEDSPVGWFGGDDQPQSAFTLQDGWDRSDATAEADSGEDGSDAEAGDRERRRPWWRPGG